MQSGTISLEDSIANIKGAWSLREICEEQIR